MFSKDEEENGELMPAIYFWMKEYANRDEETWAFEDEGSVLRKNQRKHAKSLEVWDILIIFAPEN